MNKQAAAIPTGIDPRIALLQRWAVSITQAAGAGAFGGRVLTLRGVETVRGPRAGALEIDAGIEAARLLRILSASDCATLRQFVPWHFEGEPSAFMSGRFLRLEAGWPPDLAETDIPLGSLARNPRGGGRWAAGKNEASATVTLGLDGGNPHFLIAGQTGSGKTWAMRSALVQLAQDTENRLILIDAKWGDGLGILAGLPGLVGPVATDLETAKAALSWAAREMRKRYAIEFISGTMSLDDAAIKAGVSDRQIRRWVTDLLEKYYGMPWSDLINLPEHKRKRIADEIEHKEGLEYAKNRVLDTIAAGRADLMDVALDRLLERKNRKKSEE